MLSEFRDFAKRGNVMDLAVGVIIGAAFGKIISSAVADVIMPPIGLVLGNVDFSNLWVYIGSAELPKGADLAAAKASGPVIHIGNFLQVALDFLIVAFVIFLFIRAINRMNKPAPAPAPAAPTTKDCPKCYSAIHLKATRCPNCTSEV